MPDWAGVGVMGTLERESLRRLAEHAAWIEGWVADPRRPEAEARQHAADLRLALDTLTTQEAEIASGMEEIHALRADLDALEHRLKGAVEALEYLVRDALASDFNEHWDSYKQALAALVEVRRGE